MHVPDVELHEPGTIQETAALLTRCRPDVRLLAGGTDLLVDLKAGRAATLHLVSLANVAALRGVAMDADGLRIGAATTISQLIDFLRREATVGESERDALASALPGGRPLVRALASASRSDCRAAQSRSDCHAAQESPSRESSCTAKNSNASSTGQYGAILEAALQMATPQIRNMATVGGNVASAVPCADLPPILIAMHASAVAWSSDGERSIPLDTFFSGVRRTALREDEILTAVTVPAPPRGFGAAYARFALREGNGIAVASVAASVELDDRRTIRDARIVLGAVAPVPKRVIRAEAILTGSRALDASADDGQALGADLLGAAADAAMESAEPISDIRASAEFRRELVDVLTRRALIHAAERACVASGAAPPTAFG